MPWNYTNLPPWKAVQIRGFWRVTTDRGDPSDEYDVESSGDEEVARLQAAAPTLLAACEAYMCLVNNPLQTDILAKTVGMLGMMRTAIAAAKGKQ